MIKNVVLPFVLVALVAVAALVAPGWAESREAAQAEARMVEAAQAFLATLDRDQRDRVLRPFEDDARFAWYFTPVQRSGLPLMDMELEQRIRALDLLKTATSSRGYLKATGVMHLEGILAEIEGNPVRRNPENYHFWIFGNPSASEPWGWRFEGHHISMNFTSAQGIMVANPSFIGANPAQVRTGPYAGWRLLAAEEDLARALIWSLEPSQRARAVISETAPRDIITGNQRRALLESIEGIPFADLAPEQQAVFERLLAEYVENFDPQIAHPRYARIRELGMDRLHFAWAGSLEVGEPHYYRIHGPSVLIEYDNVQNNANHIHSVWRDLENDFGEDLLRLHYESADADHGHDALRD